MVVTVNVAFPISPSVNPVTTMVDGPVATVPTVNVKGERSPLGRNVHVPGAVIIPAVGLES